MLSDNPVYIENNAECVYIRNFGLQFSFKHVGEDELIDDYIKAQQDIETRRVI